MTVAVVVVAVAVAAAVEVEVAEPWKHHQPRQRLLRSLAAEDAAAAAAVAAIAGRLADGALLLALSCCWSYSGAVTRSEP